MAQLLAWDSVGARLYETGVDRGVLYVRDVNGAYPKGIAWNGLINVTESPSGADAEPVYADNIKYLNMVGAEEFGCNIKAYTYPVEFMECDGGAEIADGVFASQQTRKVFGFAYRTMLGNDVSALDLGYKLHLVYGCLAAPSSKDNATINDTPEAMEFSWDVTTTPVAVPGFKPSSVFVVDSTKTLSGKMDALEAILYGATGTPNTEGRLPLPSEIITLMSA